MGTIRIRPDINKFCKLDNLRNESDVEQFLVVPLLADLGYGEDYLETKVSIDKVPIGKGRKKREYVPDYLGYTVRSKIKPVLIVDAKHPNKSAESGVQDAQLYASTIRRRMPEPKPEQYCIGINGHRVVVKHYDSDKTMYSLRFSELIDGHPTYEAFRSSIERDSLAKVPIEKTNNNFEFRSVAPVEIPAIFESCHRSIWKAEKRSPASAFYEFAKVMFVKIDEDRRLHEYLNANHIDDGTGTVPSNTVCFSVDWIQRLRRLFASIAASSRLFLE